MRATAKRLPTCPKRTSRANSSTAPLKAHLATRREGGPRLSSRPCFRSHPTSRKTLVTWTIRLSKQRPQKRAVLSTWTKRTRLLSRSDNSQKLPRRHKQRRALNHHLVSLASFSPLSSPREGNNSTSPPVRLVGGRRWSLGCLSRLLNTRILRWLRPLSALRR